MANYWFGRKPRYDVEMYLTENNNRSYYNDPVYIVNKVVVNNPNMYEFYEKHKDYRNVELVKGFK